MARDRDTKRARARGPERGPYRDPQEQGWRTGMGFRPVARDSDGFEPFEHAMHQLDERPVRAVAARKKTPVAREPLFDLPDDYELDDDRTPPPASGFVRHPAIPSSTARYAAAGREHTPGDDRLPTASGTGRRKSAARRTPVAAAVPAGGDVEWEEYMQPVHAPSSSDGGSRRRGSRKAGTPRPVYRRDDEDEDDGEDAEVDADDGDMSQLSVARRLDSDAHLSARRARLSSLPGGRSAATSLGGASPPPASARGRRSIALADTALAPVYGDEDEEEEEHRSSFADLMDDEQPHDFNVLEPEDMPPPPPASTRASGKGKARAPRSPTPEDDADEDEEEVPPAPPARASAGKARASAAQSLRGVSPDPDEEDGEMPGPDDEELSAAPSARAKGKQRATDPPAMNVMSPPMDDYAEDYGPGAPEPMEDELPGPEDEPEDEPAPEPAPTKGKKNKKKRKSDIMEENDPPAPARTKKPRAPRTKATAQRLPLREGTIDINQGNESEADSVDDSGLRRGRRRRYPPLDWWRLEHVQYGRGKELAEIKKIVTLPKEPVRPLGKQRGGRKTPARGRSTDPKITKEAYEAAQSEAWNPEEGWDRDTETDHKVLDYVTQEEVKRRIVWTASRLELRPAEKNAFMFSKYFTDSDVVAAGIVEVPVGKTKPGKNTRDNTYAFYLIEGAVDFIVHKSTFTVCQGGSVLVPRGNIYSIKNRSTRPARLFFAQARIREDEDALEHAPHARSSASVAPSDVSSRRGSSRG